MAVRSGWTQPGLGGPPNQPRDPPPRIGLSKGISPKKIHSETQTPDSGLWTRPPTKLLSQGGGLLSYKEACAQLAPTIWRKKKDKSSSVGTFQLKLWKGPPKELQKKNFWCFDAHCFKKNGEKFDPLHQPLLWLSPAAPGWPKHYFGRPYQGAGWQRKWQLLAGWGPLELNSPGPTAHSEDVGVLSRGAEDN